MKKTLISLVFLFGVLSAASAQEKSFDFNKLYGAFNITSGGAPNLNFTTKDFAIESVGVEMGYRFTPSFSLFALATGDINLLNYTSTKNFNKTGTVGLGAAYAFNIGNNTYIEPVISCATTYMKTDLNYLTPKFEIRWGTKNPWNKNSQFGPYLGVGLQYIHPYNTSTTPNMLMGCATIGFKLF